MTVELGLVLFQASISGGASHLSAADIELGYSNAIRDELASFQADMDAFMRKMRSSGSNMAPDDQIGSAEEKIKLRKDTDEMERFVHDLGVKTIPSL